MISIGTPLRLKRDHAVCGRFVRVVVYQGQVSWLILAKGGCCYYYAPAEWEETSKAHGSLGATAS